MHCTYISIATTNDFAYISLSPVAVVGFATTWLKKTDLLGTSHSCGRVCDNLVKKNGFTGYISQFRVCIQFR